MNYILQLEFLDQFDPILLHFPESKTIEVIDQYLPLKDEDVKLDFLQYDALQESSFLG